MVDSSIKTDNLLYKYMSFETALKVLDKTSLKWSSPVDFTDRFDSGIRMLENFVEKNVKDKITRIIISAISKKKKRIGHYNGVVVSLINGLRQEKFDKEKVLNVINDFYQNIYPPKLEVDAYQSLLDKYYLYQLRVICFTKRSDNERMWDLYADGYKGVVLGFDQNNMFLRNEPDKIIHHKSVQYRDDDKLLINKPSFFAAHYLLKVGDKYLNRLSAMPIFEKKKSYDTEEEIRFFYEIPSQKINEEKSSCSFNRFNPEGLKKIFLGDKISENDQKSIKEQIVKINPNIEIYLLKTQNNKIKFEKIDCEV
ncbi:MAG: DUF2971 domain-containing protein [Gilliamella sp.]|nr:DUF2971 domain-containing protein [Gilliamella sp.]